jgi:uncharacterized protein
MLDMSRSVFWRGIQWLSLEHLRLETDPVIRADGLVVGEYEGEPFRLRYLLECDERWRVRRLLVQDLRLRDGVLVDLEADGGGRWRAAGGEARADLEGCIDVDISATPFTNTLPIRRLGLEPGGSSEIDVVYVDAIPALEVRREAQRYTCLEAREHGARYLYQSVGSGFRAELEVDAGGLVLDYPDLWERPIAH